MNVYRSLAEVPATIKPTALTIGVFDGVHRGHQALMRTVVERAHELGATPVVVTFDRHPLEVIAPGKEPPLLTTLDQRARAMADVGIQALVVLPFDDALRHLAPEDFVREILVERLGAIHVVIGANFRFGHMQAGTIETLSDLGHRFGFATTIFALQMGEDEIVSSSMIRRHLAAGEVEKAAEELTRPFTLTGSVERGASRGKGLGFPTANLKIPARMLLPAIGVYAGWTVIDGVRYAVATNVGVNPTFGDRIDPIVEVHIIDFDGDLYGQTLEVAFTHRLRDEMRFDSVDDLVTQMKSDVERARALARG